jgi:hypothetical protein
MTTTLPPTGQDFEQMMQMLTGFFVTQIAGAVVNYSIADHLAKGPATADEIAELEDIDPNATSRLLRACASLGLPSYDDDGGSRITFHQSPITNHLSPITTFHPPPPRAAVILPPGTRVNTALAVRTSPSEHEPHATANTDHAAFDELTVQDRLDRSG